MTTFVNVVGKCPEGMLVVTGVFALYETYGLPLGMILGLMWDKGYVPDWFDLINDMVKAGKPFDRCIGFITEAVYEAAYPPLVQNVIIERLRKLKP